MSCERRVHTFQQVEEVRIECCDKKELEELEKTIISSIEQKLEKLNILIKNCNVYSGNGMILVNDRYNRDISKFDTGYAFRGNIRKVYKMIDYVYLKTYGVKYVSFSYFITKILYGNIRLLFRLFGKKLLVRLS